MTIGSSSIFHIGDVFIINPHSTSKTYAGAGSFITGDEIQIQNKLSTTNTYDNDAVDQPKFLNL